MSDDTPSAPQKRPRPPQGQRPPPQRPRRAAGAPSRESRFIGYLVLGFGVVAVIAVLILAFSQSSNVVVAVPDAKKVDAIVAEMKPVVTAAPEPPPKVDIKRQPDIDATLIAGVWQGMIGKYTAVIQMNKGVYQVILASPDVNATRKYSSGVYTILEDIITFTPKTDWPEPASQGGMVLGYDMITRAPFSILSSFQKGRMIWQNVPQTEKRVITSLTSPLFMSENVDYVVWQPIKR